MTHRFNLLTIGLFAFALLAMSVAPAFGTAQWSRKYGVSCNTCHNGFPRLNAYGERYMWNGYQDPDAATPDGATQGKVSLNEDTQIDKVEHYVGLRLNLTPFRMQSKSLTVEGDADKSKITWGETNWFQIFYAGSINKNLSIFIESEYTQGAFHFSWYYLGLHNLAGSSVNFQIGNLSPINFASYPNRLRIFPAMKGDIFGVKSSGGASAPFAAEDPVNLSSARHGIQYYGYSGPIIWWGGFGPGGSKAVDPNDQLNFWAGGRYTLPEDMGSMAGSNASIWFYSGTDASNTAGSAPGDSLQHTNAFTRISPQFNLRMNALDVQAAYVIGNDDNWTLAHPDSAKTEFAFSGFSLVGGYWIGKWNPGLQFDQITSDDDLSMERTYLTPMITKLFKENIRVGLYYRLDIREEVKPADETPDKPAYTPKNDLFVNIRVMI